MDNELYTADWLNEDFPSHFEELYKHIYKRLFLFARNFLMDEELAEDMVQDVFLGLWNKGREMRGDIPLVRYLYTATKNLCVDYHRHLNIRDKYQKHVQETETFVCLPAGEDEEENERHARVRKLMDELPEMQRKVVEMSVVEGVTYKEVAKRLDIAEGTVHTHIKRAYKYIKSHFTAGAFFWFLFTCMK